MTHLDPGTYEIAVDDRSAGSSFHLTGPGVDIKTGIDEIVQTTWTVTFTDGTYLYFCDYHARGDAWQLHRWERAAASAAASTASTGKVRRSEGRGQVTCEGEEETQHCTLSNGRRASRTVTPPARHRLLAESEARCTTSSRNQDWYARKSRQLGLPSRGLRVRSSYASPVQDEPALWSRVRGEGSPTVVFEAGGGEDASVWDELEADVRERNRVRTMVYDRAGLGRSPPRSSAYSIDGEAEALRLELDRHSVDGPIVLVAHSYGAFIATLLAGDRSARSRARPRGRQPRELLRRGAARALARDLHAAVRRARAGGARPCPRDDSRHPGVSGDCGAAPRGGRAGTTFRSSTSSPSAPGSSRRKRSRRSGGRTATSSPRHRSVGPCLQTKAGIT